MNEPSCKVRERASNHSETRFFETGNEANDEALKPQALEFFGLVVALALCRQAERKGAAMYEMEVKHRGGRRGRRHKRK